MKETVSRLDIDYFNRYERGYFPYSDKDLNIILSDLLIGLKRMQNVKICEMGCGSGQFSKELAKRIPSKSIFYGVDISEVILRFYPFNRIISSAFITPFESGFFDALCYPASLHHLYPFKTALHEMDRLLKRNGLFFCMEPNYYHPHRFLIVNHKFIYRMFKKVNDVPIKLNWLIDFLSGKNYSIQSARYVNIEFNTYSVFQHIQNLLSSTSLAKRFPKYFLPWFILIAQKN